MSAPRISRPAERTGVPTATLRFHETSGPPPRRGLDVTTLPARSEAVIHLALTDLVDRRLTGETALSWRETDAIGPNALSRMGYWERTTSRIREEISVPA
ncbi:hypothetical protein [Streptomyces sp. NPDC052042]|uniref:hypothetical protein n=1 Tax=Streptomyces sp. NPDC052042 TaxID=3365683 RepID=UPI0037D32BD2